MAAAGFQAHAEALDDCPVCDQAGVLLVGHWRQLRKYRLVVAEHQDVAGFVVLEMEADAFLFAQPLDEMQVALVVLHAVVSFGIDVAELEAIGIGLDPMAFQHLGDDLRHAKMLEDALVAAVRQISQLRTQAEAVAGQALA